MSHEFNSGRDSGCKRKAAKLSCITTFRLSRDGGTGRRSGLKIRRASALGGSIPPPGTTAHSCAFGEFKRRYSILVSIVNYFTAQVEGRPWLPVRETARCDAGVGTQGWYGA